MALGRVEDAVTHVEQVNQLYLSTIETLATAIDAKDQVTHGHIRRVQRFAIGLAEKVGVTDSLQIKALEAAGLLHDMGKIAVPEHILNKPGKLTAGEFEKMKVHAAVGADILSSIKFPYPIVPIVRHHHENWDGTGYPDRLKGTQIPLGARILAVVDCFDALTSDRPYRRRLSDDEAVAVLMERRGVMYDPLVVDVFVAVRNELADAVTDSLDAPTSVEGLLKQTIAGQTTATTLAMAQTELQDAIGVILNAVEAEIDCLTSAFYMKHQSCDEVSIVTSRGHKSEQLLGLTVQIGARVSGWVVANVRSILNADAMLEFPDWPEAEAQTCSVMPVHSVNEIVGALLVTRSVNRPLTSDEVRYIEQLCARFDETPLRDLLSRANSPMRPNTKIGRAHV